MSNRKFPEYEDDPTMVAPSMNLGHHPANTDPFEAQQGNVVSSVDLSGEATMVVEGPDLSTENTLIHDSLANPLAPVAKLLVQDGVQQGKEYPLLGTEISFGREKDNTISHPDLSVSRRHFKIHYKGDKFILEDLGSSSGTLLNNKRVKGTSKLQHGDRIQVGKTLLEFQMLDESAQGRPGGNGIVIGLIVGLLALSGVGVGVYFMRPGQDPPPPDAGTVGETRRPPPAQSAQAYIKRGLVLRSQMNWRLAKLQFQQASQLAPNSFQAQQLFKEIKAEEKVDFLIRRADAKRMQSLNKEAYDTLEKASQQLAPSSVHAEKVWRLRLKLMPKASPILKSRRGLNDAKWYFKQGEWQKAELIFTKRRKRKKLKALQIFIKKFNEGLRAYRKWQPKTAIPLLREAYAQDLQLTGNNGFYADQLKQMLATMYCAQGINAMAKKTEADYPKAYKSFRKATVYVPTHTGSQARIKSLRELATKWLKKARIAGTTDRKKANSILKSILPITSRTDAVNKEARRLLK